jgi:enoyl-CoA hydratase/carnithine racemase
MTEAFTTIRVARDGPVATITLDRPDRLNATDRAMHAELPRAWRMLDADPDVRAIVVTGAGTRAFCAGQDLREVAEEGGELPSLAPRYADAIRLTALQNAVWKPVVTAVNGVCAGGGLHFVADSDIVIAAEHASFVDTHTAVGFVSSCEAIGLARRIPLDAVMRLVLLGRAGRIDAAAALRLGLVGEVVAQDALMARAMALAGAIAANSPAAVRESKRAIWESLDRGLGDALQHGWDAVRAFVDHPDYREGPRAFADKRPPRWAR